MSEISDEGQLPPNVHHPRPEKPASTDEEADRERVEEGAEGDGGEPRRDERADRQPPADTPHARRGDTDDPYARQGEDPYVEPEKSPQRTGHDEASGDGTSEDTVGTGASGTGAAGTAEPPD
ncbi:hypothetical protein SAMN04488591_2414 [Microbacterium azadirachtae]|uniref:Uncharacterized protein n=1 Tax=Microbacterium azadirachtae TaxID=582680 RepID=A0A1I6I4G2_9MICO|nr:hypothetical protein [Microbacterium azadirachtae]SFR61549.1 hypothetical protein SAMN04488591_2414 [Microbacterium azadirachtae]